VEGLSDAESGPEDAWIIELGRVQGDQTVILLNGLELIA